jgi:hypothetical protein
MEHINTPCEQNVVFYVTARGTYGKCNIACLDKKKMLHPILYKSTLGIVRQVVVAITSPAQHYIFWSVHSDVLKAPIPHLPGT